MGTPAIGEQVAFWDGWNKQHRTGADLDDFQEAQRDVAVEVARRSGLAGARILDAGCGVGWLGAALTPFGEVTGTDLSAGAVAEGQRRYPGVHLVAGDFATVKIAAPFDMVVSADVIAHVPDQQAFVDRIAALLKPGGTFLLMSQNALVWNRVSYLRPRGEGQIRDWPSVERIRALLAPAFTIRDVDSIVPGGDQGALWWVENRWVRGGMGRIVGRARWRRLLERSLLGRELVVTARRR